jgi:CubicO group peptidase (beta-lactamase class C family)
MRTLAGALLLAAVVQAQPSQKQAEVDRIFSAFNTHTPGCAVGIAHNGTVVLKAGYGMADLERNVPITPKTVFESGSVAKQFTAAAVMLLAQQGKISLDDPMRKYLPELPDYGAPLTIRHVLSHVSGLRDWRALAVFSGFPEGTHVYSNQNLLQMAAKQSALNFDPGTNYSYTNTGFNISAILIERALGNGKTFQTFTRETIFGPLGMAHTRWRDDFRAVVPNRALAYGRSGGAIWIQRTPIENVIGAGGLLTTVGDLLLWNENFTHARVGGPEFVKAQQTPATLRGGRTIPYAAGLAVAAFNGLREVSHAGATGGYRTWLGRYPDQAVSVAVLCNSAQANPATLGRDTGRLWTGATPIKAPTAAYTADPAKLQPLAGMYRKERDNTVSEFRWRNGKLTVDPEIELVPVAAGKFLHPASEREFNFEEGTPVRLRVVTAIGDILYERVEPAQPTAAELAALTGEYESREAGATLTLALGAKPGELTYQIGSNSSVPLRPTFRDAFATPSGSSIRFVRDSAGKVIALSAGEDRVWDLRFERVR